jgi:hypothetical protein
MSEHSDLHIYILHPMQNIPDRRVWRAKWRLLQCCIAFSPGLSFYTLAQGAGAHTLKTNEAPSYVMKHGSFRIRPSTFFEVVAERMRNKRSEIIYSKRLFFS